MKNEAARSVFCQHWAGEPRPYAGEIIIYGPLATGLFAKKPPIF